MSVKFYLFAVSGWILIGFVGALIDGAFFGKNDLDVVLSLQVIDFKEILSVPIPVPNLEFFSSAINLATWNSSIFNTMFGSIVRLFIGLALMGALVYGLVTTLLPVLISGAQAIANLIDAVNPFS